jgi:hypothetical protein
MEDINPPEFNHPSKNWQTWTTSHSIQSQKHVLQCGYRHLGQPSLMGNQYWQAPLPTIISKTPQHSSSYIVLLQLSTPCPCPCHTPSCLQTRSSCNRVHWGKCSPNHKTWYQYHLEQQSGMQVEHSFGKQHLSKYQALLSCVLWQQIGPSRWNPSWHWIPCDNQPISW